jgi:hypothetical protein
MTGIRMPDIELTDKCRSELDEFTAGTNDHVDIYTSYDVEDDTVTVTFTCPYEVKQEMDSSQIGTTFEEFVRSNEHVVDNVFETMDLVDETEFTENAETVGRFSFRVKY